MAEDKPIFETVTDYDAAAVDQFCNLLRRGADDIQSSFDGEEKLLRRAGVADELALLIRRSLLDSELTEVKIPLEPTQKKLLEQSRMEAERINKENFDELQQQILEEAPPLKEGFPKTKESSSSPPAENCYFATNYIGSPVGPVSFFAYLPGDNKYSASLWAMIYKPGRGPQMTGYVSRRYIDSSSHIPEDRRVARRREAHENMAILQGLFKEAMARKNRSANYPN